MEPIVSQDAIGKRLPGAAIAGTDAADPILPLELLELELSLEGFSGGEPGFCEAVRNAASAIRGDFLFDLPAAGLISDCRRLAVIRIPEGDATTRTLFAALDEDGAEIRLLQPDDETEHLLRFADAFVDLLRRLPAKPKEAA
ncbi:MULTISPECIES: hypothetical protein [unclassified Rhizobium]|uniref:hypothetical protein n=1 Tax=unclassified Rhizobium TaxID=2613769 RepID=UPI000EA9B4F3|nr:MULTISPECIES: hypothetical protein [unclassified Rhizobium]AYG65468.1 hypothetical protein CCGE531_05275 [Rhizobium sp. CCGE531]AYG71951.1 hypothetical protein CCGE532_05270 [Rhizobium sp. CCGE532]